MVNRVQIEKIREITQTKRTPITGKVDFKEILAREISFSKHAMSRITEQGIKLTDDVVTRLADAVKRAEDKGSREALVLFDDVAFIVNVRTRNVVTAIGANRLREYVFTNIDSVVLANGGALAPDRGGATTERGSGVGSGRLP